MGGSGSVRRLCTSDKLTSYISKVSFEDYSARVLIVGDTVEQSVFKVRRNPTVHLNT